MTTIGDVLMVFGGAVALGFGAWCLVMLVNLLFPQQALKAAEAFANRAPAQIGLGAIVGLPTVLFALVLLNLPLPIAKLAGVVVLVAVVMVASLGFAGLAKLCGERVTSQGGAKHHYEALAKGTLLLVGAGLFPLIGWFVLAPLGLLASIGGGVRALRSKPDVQPGYRPVA
jgi:hypothetical protein